MEKLVEEFMTAFGQLPPKGDQYDLRLTLIEEEATELEEATTDIEELDALVDLAYVTYGAYYALGIPMVDPEHLIMGTPVDKQAVVDVARSIYSETIDADLDTILAYVFKYAEKYDFEGAFKEVHRSNMSKLDNGKPIYREDGKVLKGPNYSPPDLSPFV
jgi:hypothetical protein